MENLNLTEVLETLENSPKWTGNWKENGYKKFIYVPANSGRFTTLYIPIVNGEPDLTSPWIGRVLTQQYILVTLHYDPNGKTWEHFLQWLSLMVTNPDALLDV